MSRRAINKSRELAKKPSAEQLEPSREIPSRFVLGKKASCEQLEPVRFGGAKKASCEQLESPSKPVHQLPPSKKPSCEQLEPPKPVAVVKKASTEPAEASPKQPQPSKQTPISKPAFDAHALKKMADRAKKKMDDKEKKEKEKAERKKEALKKGDDAFPKYANLKTTEEVSKVCPVVEALNSVKITGKAYLARTKTNDRKNNDNNGQLFVKDPASSKEKPFWHSDQLYQPTTVTEDEFVLNAETLVNVANNSLQLAKSDVDWQAKCDTFAKLSSLQDKDEAAFKNPIVYGNSVRSMMNVERLSSPDIMDITAADPEQRRAQEVEFLQRKLQQSEYYVLKQLQFNEPNQARVYKPGNLANLRFEPFVPPEEVKITAA